MKFFQKRIYYGWIIVVAAFLCLTFTYGLRYAFGVFFTPMCEEFGWTRTTTSGVFSLYMIFYAVGAPITGRMVDKYGPKILMISGACLLGLGMLGCSIISKIWQLYLFYGVLVGLGSAAAGWICATTTISKWFIKKRGIATGIASAGIGLGSAIFAPLVALLITSFDWRTSYAICGVLIWAVSIPLASLMVKSPEDKGLCPDGISEYEKIKVAPAKELPWEARDALKTSSYRAIFLTHLLMAFQLQMVMVHLVPYAIDVGIDRIVAAGSLGLLGLISIVGRIGGGWLSDRIGRKATLAASMAIQGICLLFLPKIIASKALYIFVVVYGISYGGWAPLFAPLTADIFGRASLGTLWGIITIASGIGGAIGPLFAGWFYDTLASYSQAFIIGGIISIIASILFVLLVKLIKNPVKVGLENKIQD
ncbi:MAG: MFS transporter [Candidatus Aerophobetes bacterium]|nr:MFS transporter [Candidatus Aerophobetes bacterium]